MYTFFGKTVVRKVGVVRKVFDFLLKKASGGVLIVIWHHEEDLDY